ncbi:hypothetical protein SEA_RAVENCO17_71 [Gordonia phage RavenCo17]|nr:hypothetical protein SEA_RAVENCO17_71 [Gordonia phage RavenCo17]
MLDTNSAGPMISCACATVGPDARSRLCFPEVARA